MYVPKTLINSDSYEDALYSYYIQKAKDRILKVATQVSHQV